MLPKLPKPSKDNRFDAIYTVDSGSTDGTVELFQENSIPVFGQSKKGRGQTFHEAFDKIPEMGAFIFFSPEGNDILKTFLDLKTS